MPRRGAGAAAAHAVATGASGLERLAGAVVDDDDEDDDNDAVMAATRSPKDRSRKRRRAATATATTTTTATAATTTATTACDGPAFRPLGSFVMEVCEGPTGGRNGRAATEGSVPTKGAPNMKEVDTWRGSGGSSTAERGRETTADAAPASLGGSDMDSAREGNGTGPIEDDTKLYKHAPLYLKTDPLSLMDVYDEFKGLGPFLDVPIKGGIAGLVARFPRSGSRRPYFGQFGGKQYRKNKIASLFVQKLDSESELKGIAVQDLLDELVSARQLPPFDWDFLEEYCGGATSNRVVSSVTATHRQRNSSIRPERPSHKEKDSETVSRTVNGLTRPYIPVDQLLAGAPYVEESAFLYHDPPDHVALSPLPQSRPRPRIPDDLAGRWSYDETEPRILRADFSGWRSVPKVDKKFLRRVLQDAFIAVVFDGLLETDDDGGDDDRFVWSRGSIEAEIGSCNFFHKFRHFSKVETLEGCPTYIERDEYIHMTASDFMRYLALKEKVVEADMVGSSEPKERLFRYSCSGEACMSSKDGKCSGHVIEDVCKETIYMTDVEVPTFLHRLKEKFYKSFKLHEMLPGGDWCIMNSMTPSSRPFMGPNLYISPGGAFTHFHLDGHGTVDSGHYVVDGFNEVVILSRLPERHKFNSVDIMNNTLKSNYSPLYNLPHDDNNEKPGWPTNATIDEWEKMGYAPIRLVLRKGQFLHIGKGRPHVFRKLSNDPLEHYDCHRKKREQILHQLRKMNSAPPTCISIAWDWNFYGSDAEGINREVSSMLESALRCQHMNVKALATPGRALLAMGSYIKDSYAKKTLTIQSHRQVAAPNEKFRDIARGILPSLEHVVSRDTVSYDRAVAAAKKRQVAARQGAGPQRFKLSQTKRPDVQENPTQSKIDARGNDYYCQLCNAELSNAYFRCDGCERHQGQDYMICVDCFVKGTFTDAPTDENDEVQSSHRTHCGHLTGSVKGRCSRPVCMTCSFCGFGSCCSCGCHTNFTMHRRMMSMELIKDMMENLRRIVGADAVRYAQETTIRLGYAADRDPNGEAGRELRKLVAAKNSAQY